MNSSSVIAEIVPKPASGPIGATARAMSWKSIVPNRAKTNSTPRTNPQSPIRLTMNAFLPASDADCFWNQKPISRYEHRPTPSQPTNMIRKFAPRTSTSMNAANRFR
jgi:hypothetical protein